MKKLILLNYAFFICIIVLNAQTNSKQNEDQEKFILEATVKGFEDSVKIIVNVFRKDMSIDRDNETTAYILNGKFVLSGDFEQPTKLSIRFHPKDPENIKDFEYLFLWVENKRMYLEGEKGKMYAAQVSGSKIQDQYAEYVSKIAPFIIENKQITDSSRTVKDLPAIKKNEFRTRSYHCFQEKNKIENEFIFTHPKYYFTSAEIVCDLTYSLNILDRKRINQFFDQLPDNYKTNVYGMQIKDFINKTGMAYNRSVIEKKAVLKIRKGKTVPDFKLKTATSEDFSLYSIRDKYIVLDFWSSGCGPCIKGFPKMKEYYNKYKRQIEFIGIGCYEKIDTWKNSIQSNQLDWLQVINEKGLESDVYLKYGIKGLPTKIILDKEKKIIGIFLGEREDFYKKLDELMMHN
jgi:thiol-disulfide isomerase/thioredoxin